jgi:hypothetical protein
MTTFLTKKSLFFQFLTTDGTKGGTREVNTDFVATPADFFVTPPDTRSTIFISTMIMYLEDGAGQLDPSKYGNLAALTNGVELSLADSSGKSINLIVNAKNLRDWIHVTDDTGSKNLSAGNDVTQANINFPLPLQIDFGERFQLKPQDILTGLVSHTFYVYGRLEERESRPND